MPRITPYESQVSQNGTLNVRASAEDFGGQSANALIGAGGQLSDTADTVNAVEESKSRIRAANQLTQHDLDWRQQMIQRQNDPEFAKKYGEDGSGFAAAFKTDFETFAQKTISEADPRDRKYVQQGMYNLGESLMNSSMQFEAEVGSAFAVNTLKKSIDNARVSATMSPEQFTSIMANTQMVVSQTQHIDPAKRIELMDKATRNVTVGAVTGMLEKNGVATANALMNNSLTFTTLDANGNPVKKKVSELVGADIFDEMRSQAKSTIKKANSAVNQAATDLKDDVSTNISLAETPDQFLKLAEQIEANKGVWKKKDYNDLRVQLHDKTKKMREDIDSVDRGNAFASGKAYLNPNDTDAVKDYNKYYERAVEPTLADMPPEARNTRLANLVAETKVMPDRLKGDIKIAARSMDKDVVVQTADFVDRLRATNPHLIQDIGQKDLARVDMVNQRIASGLTPTEAFEQVDNLLTSTTPQAMKDRSAFLKTQKIDYQQKAMDNFERSVFVRMLPGNSGNPEDKTSPIASRQIQQLTADYRQAYESQYKITGDETASEKYANQIVSGTYGTTAVNGRNQIMRYAPEKYFSIANQNNDWMRQQLMEQINSLGPQSANMKPGEDISDRYMLAPDPFVTPRTAKEGRPLYKIYFNREDGGLTDVLGPKKYFTFDPAKRRSELIDESSK